MDLGEFWHAVFHGGQGWHDFDITTRTGSVLPTSWTSVRTSDGSMIALGIDISARKEIEQEVSRLATAMEQAGDGIALFDRAFRVQYVNRAFEDLFEKGRDEVVGRSLDTLQGLFRSDGEEGGGRSVLELLQSGSGAYSGTFTRKRSNGNELTVTVSIATRI